MAAREQPVSPPRPLFDSLPAAARAAVAQFGFNIAELNFERWAQTYGCSADQVEQALKIALNGKRKLPEEVAAAAPPAIQSDEG